MGRPPQVPIHLQPAQEQPQQPDAGPAAASGSRWQDIPDTAAPDEAPPPPYELYAPETVTAAPSPSTPHTAQQLPQAGPAQGHATHSAAGLRPSPAHPVPVQLPASHLAAGGSSPGNAATATSLAGHATPVHTGQFRLEPGHVGPVGIGAMNLGSIDVGHVNIGPVGLGTPPLGSPPLPSPSIPSFPPMPAMPVMPAMPTMPPVRIPPMPAMPQMPQMPPFGHDSHLSPVLQIHGPPSPASPNHSIAPGHFGSQNLYYHSPPPLPPRDQRVRPVAPQLPPRRMPPVHHGRPPAPRPPRPPRFVAPVPSRPVTQPPLPPRLSTASPLPPQQPCGQYQHQQQHYQPQQYQSQPLPQHQYQSHTATGITHPHSPQVPLSPQQQHTQAPFHNPYVHQTGYSTAPAAAQPAYGQPLGGPMIAATTSPAAYSPAPSSQSPGSQSMSSPHPYGSPIVQAASITPQPQSSITTHGAVQPQPSGGSGLQPLHPSSPTQVPLSTSPHLGVASMHAPYNTASVAPQNAQNKPNIDPIAAVTGAMANMGIGRTYEEEVCAIVDAGLRLPPIRDMGPPNDPLPHCPGEIYLYPATWHFLPAAPDSLWCSACYTRLIAGTPLEREFRSVVRDWGVCAAVTIHSAITARNTGNTQLILDSLKRCAILPPCPGAKDITRTQGIDVYRIKPAAHPPSAQGYKPADDLHVCEHCYHNTIKGSKWEDNFERYPLSQDEKIWCDLRLEHVKGLFWRLAASRDPGAWHQWILGAKHRLLLPDCDGKEVENARDRKWYAPRRQIAGMVICEACFLDHVSLTRFAHEFELHPVRGASCDMHGLWINFAWAAAVASQDNYDLWWHAANGIVPWLAEPGFDAPAQERERDKGTWACSPGSSRKLMPQWFTLGGPAVNWDVCSKCYFGHFVARGLERHLVQKQVAPEESANMVCDMCIEPASRGLMYVSKLCDISLRGVWAEFDAHVRHFVNIPACPRRQYVTGRKWWGFPELLICAECWEDYASKLPFATNATIHGSVVDSESICSMYSPRMRGLWLQASKGAISQADLLDLSRNRTKIYWDTEAMALILVNKQNHELMMFKYNLSMSMIKHTAAAMTQHSGAHRPDLTWHDAMGGSHATQEGAQSANYSKQANGHAFGAVSGWDKIVMLEYEWLKHE